MQTTLYFTVRDCDFFSCTRSQSDFPTAPSVPPIRLGNISGSVNPERVRITSDTPSRHTNIRNRKYRESAPEYLELQIEKYR